jgi:hypothetical protein
MTKSAFQPDERVIDKFIRWIEQPQFDQQHAKNWAREYKNDPEAAMCEATFWAALTDCGVDVRPNRDLEGSSNGGRKSPDFLCQKMGVPFYVEVTCLREEVATRKTSLQPGFDGKPGAFNYELLTQAIFDKCKSKTLQCSNLDAPCILAIGTFHYRASILAVRDDSIEEILTGETGIGFDFDSEAGRSTGPPYQVTSFRWSPFTRKSNIVGAEHTRQPISAILVGGFGCSPPHVLGALHPNPILEFDPRILDQIAFCRQRIDWESGRVGTEWLQLPTLPARAHEKQ